MEAVLHPATSIHLSEIQHELAAGCDTGILRSMAEALVHSVDGLNFVLIVRPCSVVDAGLTC